MSFKSFVAARTGPSLVPAIDNLDHVAAWAGDYEVEFFHRSFFSKMTGSYFESQSTRNLPVFLLRFTAAMALERTVDALSLVVSISTTFSLPKALTASSKHTSMSSDSVFSQTFRSVQPLALRRRLRMIGSRRKTIARVTLLG